MQEFFAQNSKVALAFSGGVDSAYLLYLAKESGAQIRAYYVKTPFQPQFEYEDAISLTRQLDVPLQVVDLDILSHRAIAENPCNRCYLCKKQIFTAIRQQAEADGFSVIIDGTNADDKEEDRPGMQALREVGIRSPLREWGLSKAEIRKRSKEAGLFTHDKPAYACLATRFPAGTPITREGLAVTEKSEMYLKSLGFSNFRVRYLAGAAKIEVSGQQLPLLMEHRQEIVRRLKDDYNAVLLDLEVRL